MYCLFLIINKSLNYIFVLKKVFFYCIILAVDVLFLIWYIAYRNREKKNEIQIYSRFAVKAINISKKQQKKIRRRKQKITWELNWLV